MEEGKYCLKQPATQDTAHINQCNTDRLKIKSGYSINLILIYTIQSCKCFYILKSSAKVWNFPFILVRIYNFQRKLPCSSAFLEFHHVQYCYSSQITSNWGIHKKYCNSVYLASLNLKVCLILGLWR